MENALYVGLSQQMALQRQMEIVANNIANLNTTGFKGEQPLFEDYVMAAGPHTPVSYVLDRGTMRNQAPGALSLTGEPLDVALEGDGFLTVQTADGPRYTRNGHLSMDADGRVVTSAGQPVLDDGGGEITLDEGAGAPTIAPDGTISQGTNRIGRLGVVRFADPQALQGAGDGLLTAGPGQAAEAAPDTRLAQGMLEGSNVQPVVEITRMVELQRRYQTMQSLLQSDAELQRSAIQRLGRVSPA